MKATHNPRLNIEVHPSFTPRVRLSIRLKAARVMVAAPTSTIDMNVASGDDIPIEERSPGEVLTIAGSQIAADVPAWNPAFDVTPASLVDVIVTEKGVIESPDKDKIAAHMRQGE